MAKNRVKLDDDVKQHLSKLLLVLDPAVSGVLSKMSKEELKHALDTMSQYLKLDLKFYFERELQSREKQIDDFDDMFREITK